MEEIYVTDSATEAVGKINRNFDAMPNVSGASNKNEQSVFLAEMVQNGSWVRQKNIVCVVDYGIKYTFHLPEGIVAKIEYGATNSLGTSSANLFDGNSVTLPMTAVAQRISFARYTNNAVAKLTLADAAAMINNESIRVTYEDEDVIDHNLDKQCLMAALTKSTSHENKDTSSAYYYKRMPLIAHTSDLHGDIQRMWNMCKFAKRFGIDSCVVSGDAVLYHGADGNGFVFAAAEKAGVDVVLSMGNHEVYPQAANANISEASNYEKFFADKAADFNYMKSSGVTTDRAYYYHDLTEKKIRFIVIDQYDGGVYGGAGKAGRLSQAQVDWLIATLKSAPADYGIIVVMHSPENALTTPSALAKFKTTTPTSGTDSYSYASNGAYNDSSRPISKIIDAFISRSSYSSSWTGTYKGNSESVSFTADFSSGVNEGVEFICYLNGHIHTDNIGYVNGVTNRQLNINITSGNGHVSGGNDNGFSGVDDLPRRGTGATQDSFNVYAIDRTNKQVRIARIGSNVKKDLTLRDALIADYGPEN